MSRLRFYAITPAVAIRCYAFLLALYIFSVQVMGAIGPCTSLRKPNACVAETEMGEGGTYSWSLGGIDPSTTIALYFEIANASASAPVSASRRHHLQIVTKCVGAL